MAGPLREIAFKEEVIQSDRLSFVSPLWTEELLSQMRLFHSLRKEFILFGFILFSLKMILFSFERILLLSKIQRTSWG